MSGGSAPHHPHFRTPVDGEATMWNIDVTEADNKKVNLTLALKASSQKQHMFIFHWPKSVTCTPKGVRNFNPKSYLKGEENDNILNVSMTVIHVLVHLNLIQLECRHYYWSHFRDPIKRS